MIVHFTYDLIQTDPNKETETAIHGSAWSRSTKPKKDKEKESDPFGYSVAIEATVYGREVNDCCLLNLDEKKKSLPDPCSLIKYKNQKGTELSGGECVKRDSEKIHFNFRNNPEEPFQKWKTDEAKYIKVSKFFENTRPGSVLSVDGAPYGGPDGGSFTSGRMDLFKRVLICL